MYRRILVAMDGDVASFFALMRNHRRRTASHPERRALGILVALLLPTAVLATFGTEDLADLLGRLGMLATLIAALLTLYWAGNKG